MRILNRVIVSPAFTHAFLKSPSSRGLSAIAELFVDFVSSFTEVYVQVIYKSFYTPIKSCKVCYGH